MTGETPEQLSEKLNKIYETSFGGKTRGRFKIARVHLRQLANLSILTDRYISEVYETLLHQHNLILMNLDSSFCVFPATIAKGFRRVPGKVVAGYDEGAEESEAEADQD